MSTTFEKVLEQANALSDNDRKKLATILGKSNGRTQRDKNGAKDDAVIAALRAWVDGMEKSENLKRNSSAKIAERIRKQNDRGFTL